MTGTPLAVRRFSQQVDQAAGLRVAPATSTCRNSRRENKTLIETSVAIDTASAC